MAIYLHRPATIVPRPATLGVALVACLVAHCANIDSAGPPTTTGVATGIDAKGADTSEPVGDDNDLLAPSGVCEAVTDWFNVSHVLDGDTLTVDDGQFSHVRLLGVAAPEIAHPPKAAECYGLQSWTAAKKWLPEDSGVKLCMRPDPNADDKDKYGRLLRYVYFKDQAGRTVQLNARQIRRGNARLYREFSKGLQLEATFADMEKAAKADGLGGWQACGWQPRAP